MEQIARQCRYLTTLAEPVVASLDDTHRSLEPHPGTKTAGWLVGHLAVTGDFGRRLCGSPTLCPKDWRALFNPGTRPSPNAADYPPMRELAGAMIAVYSGLCEDLPRAEPRLLSADNPFVPARHALPTSGDFVAYLMTGHLGHHLGQLMVWRAAAGLARGANP
ncbi:MAG: DinB family protein [Gemmatimonadales bacterium]